jgi:hypothetical protein
LELKNSLYHSRIRVREDIDRHLRSYYIYSEIYSKMRNPRWLFCCPWAIVYVCDSIVVTLGHLATVSVIRTVSYHEGNEIKSKRGTQ